MINVPQKGFEVRREKTSRTASDLSSKVVNLQTKIQNRISKDRGGLPNLVAPFLFGLIISEIRLDL